MFQRPHHRRIAEILLALDAPLLVQNRCYFGGGTAIVLRHGEYRESLDMDFLLSDAAGFRNLRELLSDKRGMAALFRPGLAAPGSVRDVRADRYGIRTLLSMGDGQTIKFEIVLEGRMALETPGEDDRICGVACLAPVDRAASKLLANSDRWADDGVFSRDVIDLAIMNPTAALLRQALKKAEGAYGQAIRRDLARALEKLKTRPGRLERCMEAMAMTLPKALLWQKLHDLGQKLEKAPA